LRRWISDRFGDSQARFIEDCAGRGHEINQGELSGLLNKKSFGEKKARSLELAAGMPARYLDGITTTAHLQLPLIASENVATFPPPKPDKWTAEAISIFAKLDKAQKMACVIYLRTYLAATTSQKYGQAL
jgi:hypothetical protein